VDPYETYLDLLIQEEDQVDLLLALADEKRPAILNGPPDRLVAISQSENASIDLLTQLREDRRKSLPQFHPTRIAARPGLSLQRQDEILAGAPDRLKSLLRTTIRRYETKLLQLRRFSRINNTLLADRMMVLRETVERILTIMNPNVNYAPPTGPSARPERTRSAAPALVLDQKV